MNRCNITLISEYNKIWKFLSYFKNYFFICIHKKRIQLWTRHGDITGKVVLPEFMTLFRWTTSKIHFNLDVRSFTITEKWNLDTKLGYILDVVPPNGVIIFSISTSHGHDIS